MSLKNIKWTAIEPSGDGGKSLPAGGYVLRIENAEDVDDREYVLITFDVAEGEYKGFYSDEFGIKNEWSHQFKQSYKDGAVGLFRRFLDKVSESNVGFTVEAFDANPNANMLIGKLVGAAWGTETYSGKDGKDKKRKTLPSWYSSDEIRSGNFKCPKDVDSRKEEAKSKSPEARQTYDDIPF